MTFNIFKTALLSATVFTAVSMNAMATNLGEVVKTSLETNPEVKIATQNKAAILQELKQADAGFLPTVDFSMGSGHERSNNSSTRGREGRQNDEGGHRSLWRNEARVVASQMVFDGFETSSNVCQQRARFESASKNLNEVKDNIALRSVQAYLDVKRNTELVALNEINVQNHKKYLEQISKRTESGRGNKADIRQAEGRVALAESNLYSARGELRNAKATYLKVVGVPAENLEAFTSPKELLPTDKENAVARAIENNPAIHSAQYDIKAADSALDATNAAFYPRLDLELEANRGQNLDGTEHANNSYLAMARVRYNLYNGGADLARKREQAARLEEAKDTLNRDLREVEERMEEAWHNMETSKSRLTPLNDHVVSSDQTRKAYKQQFDIGQRSLLDLLDSEVEYFNAQSSYINGKYAYDFAIYNVLASSGDILMAFND